MGKKTKEKKKGKGAEKTASKTEKKLVNKLKKQLAASGEDDIETIVKQIEKEEKSRQKVIEKVVEPPSKRGNFSLIAHPDKDELIMFGGEYFNGQKTFVYNDLFFYNISRNEWSIVKAPGGPPPMCGHQMVATSVNKGQLWLFGGEYTSPTQSQFYHYRDLWVYHLAGKNWEKLNVPNGPSSRSGHRMVYLKKQLFVFGGFHDNLRDYKYFNDIYVFSLETYKWTKLEPNGIAPAPRSGCNMVPLSDGRIAIFGGYSKNKLKKDIDRGQIHNDMFILTPEKNDTSGLKWKWVFSKQGSKISPRCSMSTTFGPNNKAYCFGGVLDEEDDENISGKFYNELYSLDLEHITWNSVTLNKKSEKNKLKCDNQADQDSENSDEKQNMEIDNNVSTVVADDGIFQVTVGPSTSCSRPDKDILNETATPEQFWPSPRMNCGLAIKRGVLYLYGGLIEDGDKQLTLSDFYVLDLHKLNEWKVIIRDDLSQQEWLESESESGNSESGSDSEEGTDDEEDNKSASSMETD